MTTIDVRRRGARAGGGGEGRGGGRRRQRGGGLARSARSCRSCTSGGMWRQRRKCGYRAATTSPRTKGSRDRGQGRTRRGMGQAGEKREESARGEGGLGLRAAAEAWGMGPLTALHYTAVLRSVELCSAVLLNNTVDGPNTSCSTTPSVSSIVGESGSEAPSGEGSTTRARLDSSPTVHSVYQYQQHSSSCALASCSIDNAPGSSSSVVLAFPFGLAPA